MEPERRIEKLLRAFAKKRREQAGDPVELRPAARRRLHNEIERRSSKKSGGDFFTNFFLAFRPKRALALCFIAVLCVGSWFLLPVLTGQKPSTLASADHRLGKALPPEQPGSMVPPALPVMTAPPVAEAENRGVFNDKEKAVSGSAALKPAQPRESAGNQRAIASNNGIFAGASVLKNSIAQTNSLAEINTATPPPASEPTLAFKNDRITADSLASASALNKDAANRPALPAPSPAASTVTRPTPAIATGEPETQKMLALQKTPGAISAGGVVFNANLKGEAAAARTFASEHFYRLNVPASRQRAAEASSARTQVLASFRVEQNGADMRIVDADGSVYTGVVYSVRDESAAPAFSPKAQSAPAAASMAKIPPQTPSAQNYYFRVAGTNRNLNQNIVFSGNLIPLTNVLVRRANANAYGGGGGGAGRTMPDSSAPLWLSNSRISGTAVIGNQKPIEINATPAP